MRYNEEYLALELYVDEVRLSTVRLPVCIFLVVSEHLDPIAWLGTGHTPDSLLPNLAQRAILG